MGMLDNLTTKQKCGVAVIAGAASATGLAPLGLWPVTLIALALLIQMISGAQSARRAFALGWHFGVGQFFVGIYWLAAAFRFQDAIPLWLGPVAVFGAALYLALYPGIAAWGAWQFQPTFNRYYSRHPGAGGGPSPDLITQSLDQVKDSRLRGNDEVKYLNQPSSPVEEGLISPLTIAFAGCWIIAEWLRSWVMTGFAWNPLSEVGVSTIFAPFWLPKIGTYGFSGIIILASGALASLPSWFRRNRVERAFAKSGSWIAIGFGVIFILPVLAVSLFPDKLLPLPRSSKANSATPTLTIVQPNISQADKYKPDYDAANYAKLAALSRPLPGQGPRLLLWPEAAIPWYLHDGYPFRYYQFQPGESANITRATLASLMGSGDILLTGGDLLEFDKNRQIVGARNAVTAMGSDTNILGSYAKAHLVPGGEYLPLRTILEPIGLSRFVPGDLDFWPGPGPQTLNLPFNGSRIKVGMQICYEIVFSGQVVDRSNRPDFIFNPSNDAWYGSWQPPQHLAMARLRAIEEGLPVIRATPTGISAVIDADGRIVASRALGTPARIDAFLPEPHKPTLFARYGNILPLAFAALLIAFSLLPLAGRKSSR
jgi:apolipoprotein N-acyltransferase